MILLSNNNLRGTIREKLVMQIYLAQTDVQMWFDCIRTYLENIGPQVIMYGVKKIAWWMYYILYKTRKHINIVIAWSHH